MHKNKSAILLTAKCLVAIYGFANVLGAYMARGSSYVIKPGPDAEAVFRAAQMEGLRSYPIGWWLGLSYMVAAAGSLMFRKAVFLVLAVAVFQFFIAAWFLGRGHLSLQDVLIPLLVSAMYYFSHAVPKGDSHQK